MDICVLARGEMEVLRCWQTKALGYLEKFSFNRFKLKFARVTIDIGRLRSNWCFILCIL